MVNETSTRDKEISMINDLKSNLRLFKKNNKLIKNRFNSIRFKE